MFILSVTAVYVFAVDSDTVSAEGVNKTNSFSFSLHPPATILYRESVSTDDYIAALSQYKKSDNRWRPKEFLRLAGQLQQVTIELPKDYSEEEVFTYYQKQLPEQASLLFSCEKRRCGDSNNWANDHFGVKQLYGLNQSQYYAIYEWLPHHRQKGSVTDNIAAAALDHNDKIYITIYTVRRGNRRLYTQLDVITAK